MYSPKYRELDKEKILKKDKYGTKKNAKLNSSFRAKFFTKKWFYMFLMSLIFIFWLIINYSVINDETKNYQISGHDCQQELCEEMENAKVSGSLCMDLCVTNSLNLPSYSDSKLDPNQFYSYYSIKGLESTLICTQKIQSNTNNIQSNTRLSDFESILYKKIEERLHHPPTVQNIMRRLMEMGDVNQDQKFSLAEANNIWQLVNNKHTYYMLMLAGKSYVPDIKAFCGSLVEVEQILNQVHLKQKSYFDKLYINFNLNWPEWNYRAKISLGILEFFLDSVSFNPNEEFGSDSLYLCSPIESSFGNTFINEAKLTRYNEILNGRELQRKLADRYCYSDSDCVYTKECHTKCDTKSNSCTSDLVKPQIVHYCNFLREYLFDNKNATMILEPIIEECETLKSFTKSNNVMYSKNKMPMNYDKHKIYIAQLNYWNDSMKYALTTNRLRTALWEFVKLTKDPQKSKKKAKIIQKPKSNN